MAHKTKGKMPEKDHERMKRNYMYVQDNITDPYKLINNLFSKGVLDDDDVTMINNAKERGRGLERERVQKLVDILMSQRAGSFQIFLQCLEETGYSDIAMKLDCDPSEYQILESLMAQQNKKRKITEEKPEVVGIMHRLSRHRNAETDLQSMDTARMTPTDTTPCRSTDVRDKVHTKSRQKRDGLRILRREAEQLNLKNKVLKATRIEEDQESKSGTLPADLSRALLPVKECSKIKEHLIFLTDELVPDHFIPFLFSNNVINDEQREGLVEVFDNQGGRKCTETLLYILMYECSETKAYGLFCQCLHEKMYYKALQKLEPNRTDITDEQLKTSRGKLPEKEYSVLQDHIELLTRGIVPSGYIMHLYSGKVFTEEDKERLNAIENKKGKTACVDAMLFLLLRCGEFGFQQFLQYLNKKNLSIFNILYPGNKKDGLAVKYSEGQHEYVFNTESVEYKEFTDRVLSNVKELLFGTMVTVVDVRKGCVQVIFEINSLDKTDKDKLEAVLQKALKSGCIGPDAISYFEFKPIDDDELTDEEVEKEIQMFEEENARLRQEHQRLLALPEKIPTGHRIPDKKTDEEVGKEIPMFEEEKVTALPEKIPTPLMYKGFRIPDTKTGRRGKKRCPMKDDDASIIMENYVCLVKTINVQYVQPFLILEFILDRKDIDRIRKASKVSRENATEELLDIVLYESGSDVFPIFVKCLYDAGYEDIISKLQPASGYIGHDAIDDDELTNEEIEKEIHSFEEENASIRNEHQRLLPLPEKIPTGHRIPDKETGRLEKKRDRMKAADVSVIVENYHSLLETIEVQKVQPYLILESILNREDIIRLREVSKVNKNKAKEELINIVSYESGYDIFKKFVKCIFDAGYENIASKLQPSLYI